MKLEQMLLASVPEQHRQFADKILADHGVPKLPEGDHPIGQLLGWTAATATPQVEVALKHPKVKLIANALRHAARGDHRRDPSVGPARRRALRRAASRRSRTRRRASTSSSRRAPRAAATRATSAAWCSGREVVEAVAPTPVLAAGGIGSGKQIAAALAMGAQGVWIGLALARREGSRRTARADRRATCRRRARTPSARARGPGKPCRMLKNDWTEAWEWRSRRSPLGMPLQFMVTGDAVARGHRYADKAKAVMFNPVGQIVGRMNEVRPVREVDAAARRGVPRGGRAAAGADPGGLRLLS